jgi:hypothetical protein
MNETTKYTGRGGYHGGGRKAKSPNDPKRNTISIVCNNAEKAYIAEQAQKANKTVSSYIIDKVCKKLSFDEWFNSHYEILHLEDWNGNKPLYFELSDLKDAFEHAD